MIPGHTAFRIVIAFFGLVAVVFGALEHEDLILQESVPHTATGKLPALPLDVEAASSVAPPGDSSVTSTQHDSGTEGTFRAELHHLRFPPVSSPPVWRRVWTTIVRANLARGQGRVVGRPGQSIVGITELRL